MNYWLISLPRVDMMHCINKGVFGARHKGLLSAAKKGDKVVCYVTKDCKIIALGELTSDYYTGSTQIFLADGSFPARFNFVASKLPSDNEIDIRSMVDDLSFITNKLSWSVFFRLSNRRLPKSDYELIYCRAKLFVE